MKQFNNIFLVFVSFLLFFTNLTEGFVSERLTDEDQARYVDLILKTQDSQTLLLENSLQSTIFGMRALTLLGKEMPEKSKLCTHLNQKRPKKGDAIFQWLFLNAKLECSLSLSPQITKYLQQGIQRSKFSTIYSASQAVFALIDNGKLGEDDIDFTTTNEIILNLIDDAGLMRESTKEKSGSPYKTGLALELIASLHQRFPDMQDIYFETATKMSDGIPALVKQGKKTGGGIIFQGSLTATVTVLSGICQFYKTFDSLDSSALDVAIINRLGKYILNNKFVENVTGIRMVLVGIDSLVSNNIYQPLAVYVKNPEINLGKDDGEQFVVSIMTINGANIEPEKLKVMKLTKIETGESLKVVDFKVLNDNSHVLNLRNTIDEAGLYELLIDLEHNEESASIKRYIRAVSPIDDIKAVVFDFSKRMGVSKVKDEKKIRLTYPKTQDVKLELNSVREARMEVSTKGRKPEQMVAVFTYRGDCKGHQICSFSVSGTAKSRKYQWRIDLNKAEYKHFTDGVYSIKVIIGDVFAAGFVEWKLGSIEVHTHVEDDTDKDYEPVDDVKMYWHPQEEIEHTFAPPPNAPNHLLALIFTGIVGTPLVFFILLQNSVFGTIKLKELTTYDYLFQIAIMLTTLLLFSYWTAFGLVYALTLLIFALIGLIGFGFTALKAINQTGGLMEED